MIGDESGGDAVYKGAIARDNESLAARTRERDIVRAVRRVRVYKHIRRPCTRC